MIYTNVFTTIFKKLLVFSLVFSLVFLGACADPGETEDPGATTIPIHTLPPIEQEMVPVQGGSLSFPIPVNPATLNPLKINNVELYNLFTLIYEKPIRIGIDGIPMPELAETWSVDATGTIWTFNLRPGVQWQRGFGEMTADDVIYTIDLIQSYNQSDSTHARYNDLIASYAADGTHKVVITLTEPGNAAIYFMTFPVVCKAYCESGSIDTLIPLGTGPYIPVEYDPREQMSLQANDLWWKQPPYIQQLTAVCYADHNTELAAFEQNLLDFLTTSVLTVNTYQKYGEIKSVDYLTQYYDCLVPNFQSPIFSDINARQALGYALDKRDIISKALLGHAVATDYPVPLDSYLSGGSTNIYEYNLQKAVDLLDQSGWKERDNDGVFEKVVDTQIHDLEFDLLIPLDKDNTYRLDVAENIAAQLKNCGMLIHIDQADEESYVRKLSEGDFDLALCSFYLDNNPDVSFMLQSGASLNYSGYADPQMDALLSACKLALDDESMIAAYAAFEDWFVQQAPQIGLYFRTNALLYSADITVSESLRDMMLFTTIPQWYLFTEQSGG